MEQDEKPIEVNSLSSTSGRALVRRSDTLVLRGIRDLEAAERAHAQAEFETGVECESNEQLAEAVTHYRNAAELGHFNACLKLGEMYVKGRAVTQDPQQAALWFRKIVEAAERGEREAQVTLGCMYRDGLGVTQDYAHAMDWWKRAAEQGDTDVAVFHIASCYHFGHGVPEDHEEEKRLLRRAAAKGHPWACYQLGSKYLGKSSTAFWEEPKELSRYSVSFRQACAEWSARRAICNYEEDRTKAYMWFKLGASRAGRGQAMCQMWCDLLREHGYLSTTQITDAEKLADQLGREMT